MAWVYFCALRDQFHEKFVQFKAMVETQIGQKVKRERSDQALEFHPKEVTKLAKQHGIILEASAIYAHDVTPLTADTTDDHSVPLRHSI